VKLRNLTGHSDFVSLRKPRHSKGRLGAVAAADKVQVADLKNLKLQDAVWKYAVGQGEKWDAFHGHGVTKLGLPFVTRFVLGRAGRDLGFLCDAYGNWAPHQARKLSCRQVKQATRQPADKTFVRWGCA
jgi:hypothetical protein